MTTFFILYYQLNCTGNIIQRIDKVFNNSFNRATTIDSITICNEMVIPVDYEKVFYFNQEDSIDYLIRELYDSCEFISFEEIHNLYANYSFFFLNSWGKFYYKNLNLCLPGEKTFEILIALRNINHIKYIQQLKKNKIDLFSYYYNILKFDYNYFNDHKIDTTIYSLRPHDLNAVNYFLLKTNHWPFDNGVAYYKLELIQNIEIELFNWIKDFDMLRAKQGQFVDFDLWKFSNATTYLTNRNNASDLSYFRANMQKWFECNYYTTMLELIGNTKDDKFIYDYIYYFIKMKLTDKFYQDKKYIFYTVCEEMKKCFNSEQLILFVLKNIIDNNKQDEIKYLEILKYLQGEVFSNYINTELFNEKNSTSIHNKLQEINLFKFNSNLFPK